MAHPLMQESIWFDKWRFDDAECKYQEKLAQKMCGSSECSKSSLVTEIAKAREQIQKSLKNNVEPPAAVPEADTGLSGRLEAVERENKDLRKVTEDLQTMVNKLEKRIAALEQRGAAPAHQEEKAEEKPVENEADKNEEEDDFELFGSDDDDEEISAEAEKIRQERLKMYEEKKSKKVAVIAKSIVVLDVKPWDDETDMEAMQKLVRSVEMDGLKWGASQFVPLAYGIKKLQISCVVEDDKVGVDDLTDKICEFEDLVQSVDIAAFNKV